MWGCSHYPCYLCAPFSCLTVEVEGWGIGSLCVFCGKPQLRGLGLSWATCLSHLAVSELCLDSSAPKTPCFCPVGLDGSSSRRKMGKVSCLPTDASVFQASLLVKPLNITFTAASMVFRIESSLGGRNIFCRERFEEGARRQGKTDREIRETECSPSAGK